MNKITPVFILFSATLGLWISAVLLSDYLADGSLGDKPLAKRGTTEEATKPLTGALESLEKRVQALPEDEDARIVFARALAEEGRKAKDGALIMRSVQEFANVLERSPNNAEALLALATICLESGVLDKAAIYYQRYLAIRPDDDKAHVDYSLALIQLGSSEQAISELQPVLARSPNLFPARFALALALRVGGKIDEARKAAEAARAVAPDQAGQEAVDGFVNSLKELPEEVAPAVPTVSNETTSPATTVENFFRNHPIVGPKVRKVLWPEANRVQIVVADFPVEQMPPFAKEKFVSNIKNTIAGVGGGIDVEIVDEASGNQLLAVKH